MTKDRLDRLIERKKEEKDAETLEFLESLRSNFEKWGNLTEKQVSAFERIEYLSSDEGRSYVAAWSEEYKKNLKPRAQICAHYYLANPPYFNDLATKILSTEDYVPTENQYRAMCENNYTTKVLKEAFRTPTYQNGDIVQIRSTTSMPYHLYPLRGKPCMVISNDAGAITTHAVGAKVYKVLPFGQSQTVDCQERHLKGFKGAQNT
jgi:hypothetical protein